MSLFLVDIPAEMLANGAEELGMYTASEFDIATKIFNNAANTLKPI